MTRRPPRRLPLDPSEKYSAKRAELSRARRRALKWAEEDIAEDPDHAHWRRQTTDGTTLDYHAADVGLLIEYDREPEAVKLIDLIDLTTMP